MSLIGREKKPELVMVRVKLEAALVGRLNEYAAHLNSSVDYIVAEAVDYIIRKDKEFKAPAAIAPPVRGKKKLAEIA